MKRNIIAVASLLLATSALAGASSAQEKDLKPIIPASKTWNSPVTAKDSVMSAKLTEATAMKKEMAYSGMGGPLEEVDASTAGKPVLADKPVKTDPILLAKYEEAAALKSGHTQTGVGGPFEDANDGTVDLAPRPATQDYPPCSPGPGDDRCIQLYEPGVRAQLASWNRGSGGLADASVKTAMGGPLESAEASWKGKDVIGDSSAGTAMGGPYEPVEGAMNGDGSNDKLAKAGDQSGDVEIASHNAFNGVGGPIEAQSGYPACSPGPGDDRCIQLYEPGVTGAGN